MRSLASLSHRKSFLDWTCRDTVYCTLNGPLMLLPDGIRVLALDDILSCLKVLQGVCSSHLYDTATVAEEAWTVRIITAVYDGIVGAFRAIHHCLCATFRE